MDAAITVRTVAARVHGRYLVRVPDSPPPWPAIVSFHGYGEDAAASMSAIQRIPGAAEWMTVAVQALHPFYTKSDRIVASWMTRQDRELAIADNIAYIRTVVEAVQREYIGSPTSIVFAGFSQGVAMAYRAATYIPADGVIALAADVPPDVAAEGSLPPVLVGRGTADSWYTDDTLQADLERLDRLASRVETCVFDGGHEWTDAFLAAAGAFLKQVRIAGAPAGRPGAPHV